MSLECPECGSKVDSFITGIVCYCKMCGTICLRSPDTDHLRILNVPEYYEYFKILQEEIKLDESESATKSCLKAIQGLHQQDNLI